MTKNDEESGSGSKSKESTRKPKIQITLPPALYEEAKAIAEEEGWALADFNRHLWVKGFSDYVQARAARKQSQPD